MFGQASPAAARARYRALDLSTKVEGATPHRLIAILFEELERTLDAIAAALANGAGGFAPGMPERRARAGAILLGLEGSLDHGAGGSVAGGLAQVYREARRLVGIGDADSIAQARAMMAEIAEAWARIG